MTKRLFATAIVMSVAVACAPAAPSPTAPPPKPAPTTAPAKPTEPAKAAPTAAPAKPAPKPTDKPAAKPADKPAAKAAFDEKAVADFYRGKTVRIIVGHAPGGGYDTYSRAIARHLGRFIPGSPTVVVENMDGAGGARAANHLYTAAPKDGTIIGHFIGEMFIRKVLGQKGLDFEVTGWGHLGAPSISEYVCQLHKNADFKSFQEAMGPSGREMILGGDGGFIEAAGLIVKDVLHANVKMVSGYGGSAKIRLAMDQGEVHGMCGNAWESLMTTSPNELKDGAYVILAQLMSQKKQGVPQGDAPLIYDLLKNDADKAFVKAGIEGPGVYARPYLLPPGVPQDRVLAMRQAFETTFKDKEFLADAEKARLTINPKSADEIERLLKAAQELPADTKARLKEIVLKGQ